MSVPPTLTDGIIAYNNANVPYLLSNSALLSVDSRQHPGRE